MNLDFYLFGTINEFAGEHLWLDTLGIFFAQYFEYALIFCLAAFLLLNFKKYIFMVLESLFAAVLAKEIFVDIIRQLVPRARPFVENQVNLLIKHPITPSFPSAHAAFYFALSTIVYLYNKKAGLLFLISAFLISVARVFTGVHWPIDIITGALIGVVSALIVYRVTGKLEKD